MAIQNDGLIFATSLMSKAFFWVDIDNTDPSNKKFRIFLFPDKLIIGSLELTSSPTSPTIDLPPSSFTEEIEFKLSELKEIKVIRNSILFCRTYIKLKNGQKKEINWFCTELDECLDKLNPVLPKGLKIKKTSFERERLEMKLKLAFIFALIPLLLLFGFFGIYFYLF